MKREIKFRALKDDMSNCTFVYGQLIYLKEELSGNVYPSITEDGILFISCLPNTESQFTGLTDKNGKEIYEGDILHYQFEDIPNEFVRWDTDNGCWETSENGLSGTDLTDNAEIIGNIYEHENLLNG